MSCDFYFLFFFSIDHLRYPCLLSDVCFLSILNFDRPFILQIFFLEAGSLNVWKLYGKKNTQMGITFFHFMK